MRKLREENVVARHVPVIDDVWDLSTFEIIDAVREKYGIPNEATPTWNLQITVVNDGFDGKPETYVAGLQMRRRLTK